MAILVTGLVLFLFPHMLREFGLRDGLIARSPSPGAYKGVYSLITLLGLILIIWGKSLAPFVMVWDPPFELRHISNFIMAPVFCLFLAGAFPTSWLRINLRNPMVLGVTLWGAAHLWANGDLASLLLFGGFTLWGATKYLRMWRTTEVPAFRARMLIWDLNSIGLGFLIYSVLFLFHGDLFGVGLSL